MPGPRDGSDYADVIEPAGHFRIYLGAAAGVGKTYAMLSEGRRRHQRGTDVVIGFVESHGRPQTEALTEGLEVVPRISVEYRGTRFEEMDLDAVLARRPKVALVDELAHTNVPGSGHNEKRWQDVLEILDAGIDVISTVNIQHLESIADAVEQITNVAIRERVPDWVLRKANQIELVDSSPEQLRRRMLHGNIYPAAKVPQALTHFFRTDNLIALRELALRFLADETEENLLEHLARYQTEVLWETSERILVSVTTVPGTSAIVRRASRMAARIKADLHAVHVVMSDRQKRSDDEKLRAATPALHRCRRRLDRDTGGRSRPGDRGLRQEPPDHPDRHRLEPARPAPGAHGWGIDRSQGVPVGRRGGDRRPHHRPPGRRRAARTRRRARGTEPAGGVNG
jgi:two-component system sensor histidine kinase KdpD